MPAFALSRSQILAHRLRVGMLNERSTYGRQALERAAWAGLQDSMPRAAVLSIHARVAGAHPMVWEDRAFIQVWGPRFSAYVIPERDRAVFTLGRLTDDPASMKKAYAIAARLHDLLDGKKMAYRDAGRALGVDPNQLRYAAPTGTVLIRWEGAGKPVIWTVPPPEVDPIEARLELARRYLHIYGPSSAGAFSEWAGIKSPRAGAAFEMLDHELTPVQTPVGNRWILTSDEESFRTDPEPAAPVRLLPSGDSYWLCHGADRQLLIPDADQQAELWTLRVWPGAVLVEGEIVGTWRRTQGTVTIETWRRLPAATRQAVEEEASSLPLPDIKDSISVRWGD